MTMTADEFVQNVKDKFPPEAQITEADVDNLKSVWGKATPDKIQEAWRYARSNAPLTPLSAIYRYLGGDGIYRPTFSERYHVDGRRVEIGTDWCQREERLEAEYEQARQNYDRERGAGSYEAKEEAECEELHQWFVDLENKTDQRIAQMQEAKPHYSKEDIEWYGELVKGVTG